MAAGDISKPCAQAGDRLLATGGVMEIEGSSGGGLTPWAQGPYISLQLTF
jgi:hypothetical protein